VPYEPHGTVSDDTHVVSHMGPSGDCQNHQGVPGTVGSDDTDVMSHMGPSGSARACWE